MKIQPKPILYLITMTLIFFYFSGSCNLLSQYNNQFILKIHHRNRESSKDSNTQTTIISITGNRLYYSWKYTGFHPNPTFKRVLRRSCSLKKSELTYIKDYIGKNRLDYSLKEIKQTNYTGNSVAISLLYICNKKRSKVEITGMTNTWNRKYPKTNLKSIGKVKKIRSLLSYIRSLAKGKR